MTDKNNEAEIAAKKDIEILISRGVNYAEKDILSNTLLHLIIKFEVTYPDGGEVYNSNYSAAVLFGFGNEIKKFNIYNLPKETYYYYKIKMIEELLNKGEDISAQNINGETPLHLATEVYESNPYAKSDVEQNFYENLFDILLKNGADPKIKNLEGATPYDMTEDKTIREKFNKAVSENERKALNQEVNNHLSEQAEEQEPPRQSKRM